MRHNNTVVCLQMYIISKNLVKYPHWLDTKLNYNLKSACALVKYHVFIITIFPIEGFGSHFGCKSNGFHQGMTFLCVVKYCNSPENLSRTKIRGKVQGAEDVHLFYCLQ